MRWMHMRNGQLTNCTDFAQQDQPANTGIFPQSNTKSLLERTDSMAQSVDQPRK